MLRDLSNIRTKKLLNDEISFEVSGALEADQILVWFLSYKPDFHAFWELARLHFPGHVVAGWSMHKRTKENIPGKFAGKLLVWISFGIRRFYSRVCLCRIANIDG